MLTLECGDTRVAIAHDFLHSLWIYVREWKNRVKFTRIDTRQWRVSFPSQSGTTRICSMYI
jgi:hypothetical protein